MDQREYIKPTNSILLTSILSVIIQILLMLFILSDFNVITLLIVSKFNVLRASYRST